MLRKWTSAILATIDELYWTNKPKPKKSRSKDRDKIVVVVNVANIQQVAQTRQEENVDVILYRRRPCRK